MKTKRVKNYGTNEEVVAAFVDGKGYPHTNNNKTMTFLGNIIYSSPNRDSGWSYGRDYPHSLADVVVPMDTPLGIRFGKDQYLLNGDMPNRTHALQMWELRSKLSGGYRWRTVEEDRTPKKDFFTTSWSALSQTPVLPDCSNLILVYKSEDLSISGVDKCKNWLAGATIEEKMGVTLNYNSLDGNVNYIHAPATNLLGIRTAPRVIEHWICGMDEGSYFVSKLPKKCYSVMGAYATLKPKEVSDYEIANKARVKRQGEWYFIPQDIPEKEVKKIYYNEMEQRFILPLAHPTSNPHMAVRGYHKKKDIFVSGRVRHPQHRTTILNVLAHGDFQIFKAVENTATGNFSTMGRVD